MASSMQYASTLELEELVPSRSVKIQEPHRRWQVAKVIAGVLSVALALSAISVRSIAGGSASSVSANAAPESLVAITAANEAHGPTHLLCYGMQSCGSYERRHWGQSPWDLSEKVGNLDWMPGVNADAFAQLAAAWRERPPLLPSGRPATLPSIAKFLRDLLRSDPFGTGDEVPYVDLHQPTGKVVAITQKQLAFLVANVLMGNDLPDSNGLTAALRRCTGEAASGPAPEEQYQPQAVAVMQPPPPAPAPVVSALQHIDTDQLREMHAKGWRWYAHFDLPDSHDAENIKGDDVLGAMGFAEQKGYHCFALNIGRAWMKQVSVPPRREQLKDMGADNPVIFFVYDPALSTEARSAPTRSMKVADSIAQAGNSTAHASRRLWWKPADILYSLLSFLAVLSEELADGSQGSTLIATAPEWDNGQGWKGMLERTKLKPPNVVVKVEGHANWGDQADFMAGGTPKQALTDIAGNVVGGGGNLCNTANTQDESLVQFYSEVLAFSFFMTGDKMLPVPMTILGARRYLNNIEGNSYGGRCGAVSAEDWLNTQIMKDTVEVDLDGRRVAVAASAFVALKSECTNAHTAGQCDMGSLVNNQCDVQRRHLDIDIAYWTQAYNAQLYNPVVQSAFSAVVKRIGTGPWGAGEWKGDSQQYFLTVWLATALLGPGLTLDYFIYDHFCENPGNQCFLLDQASCGPCMARAGAAQPMDPSTCGQQDIWGIIHAFTGRTARELYDGLTNVGKPPVQVFDSLAPVWS